MIAAATPANVIWQSEIMPPSPVTIVYERNAIAKRQALGDDPFPQPAEEQGRTDDPDEQQRDGQQPPPERPARGFDIDVDESGFRGRAAYRS